jgi:hypothetical protein
VVLDVINTGDRFSQTYLSILIVVPTVALFVWAKVILQRIEVPARVARVISLAGGGTFVAYLLEQILRQLVIQKWGLFAALKPIMPDMIAIGVCVLTIVVVGVALGALAKRVPVVRQFA